MLNFIFSRSFHIGLYSSSLVHFPAEQSVYHMDVISADPTAMKRVMRNYYKQLSGHKFNNFDEMN